MKKPIVVFVFLLLMVTAFIVLFLCISLPGWPAQKREYSVNNDDGHAC
jgi:hypothetical protein